MNFLKNRVQTLDSLKPKNYIAEYYLYSNSIVLMVNDSPLSFIKYTSLVRILEIILVAY